MSPAPAKTNPFPGLRPFTQLEDYLFFGREEQTLELLQRLGSNRFVAVVGTSGSGKSSLVRCGLLSELLGGKMLGAGALWEVAVTHPGGNPLAILTEALLDADLYDRKEEHARENLLATLSRSHFGLVEAVKQADLGEGTNFLLVVDQFEEIFRFHEAGQTQQEAANEFVSLLLEAAAQKTVPIYVVLTMRSDFIGECGQFEGLAEMVNRGEFLIPRLTREQYKRVIEGPIKVAGGQIAPRLLQRLLNDLGQQADQLPCLQHALMRTWDVWAAKGETQALDLDDYQRVGKMSQALSLHADEIYEMLASDRQRELCRGMFQALTVEESNNRGIRRPQRLGRLCQILEVSADELLPIIDAYRHSGVTFLMPSPEVELTEQTIIDISHESLMRVWSRLRQWVEEETQAAGIYHRLSESAALHQQGKAGLYRDPELGIALAWRESKRPNTAWADRYRRGFVPAMAFLDASRAAAEREEKEHEAARQRELEHARQLAESQARMARLFKRFAGALAVGLCLAVALMVWALMLRQEANEHRQLAEEKEKEAKVSGLVQLILTVDLPKVPDIIGKITEHDRRWSDPMLREVYDKAADNSPLKLHASLALLPVDPGQVDYLFGRLLEADPRDVLPVIRDALAPRKNALLGRLWAVAGKPEKGKESQRLRAAAALMAYDPESERWANVQDAVVSDLLAVPAAQLITWKDVFRPLRVKLLAPLSVLYRDVSRPAEQSLATDILVDYAVDQPQVLADLLMDADEKQFAVIYPKFMEQGDRSVAALLAEIDKRAVGSKEEVGKPIDGKDKVIFESNGMIALTDAKIMTYHGPALARRFEVSLQAGKPYRLTMDSKDVNSFLVVQDRAGVQLAFDDDGGGNLNALLLYMPPITGTYTVCAAAVPSRTPRVKNTGSFVLKVVETATGGELVKDKLAKQQANGAVALLRMNQPEKVWPLLKHSPDPRTRSYLIHRMSLLGADARALVKQLAKESDPTIRRALLLSLGEFSDKDFAPDERQTLLVKLQEMHRTATDPGLHAASEWLLRQWKEEAWLQETEQAWAKDRQQQVKRLEQIDDELKQETGSPEAGWYVNGQGQTLVVIPGPVEFWMGSLPAEVGRGAGPAGDSEFRHWRRIGRSFAISSKKVTAEQFRRFRPNHQMFVSTNDCPANGVSWYDAAAYCNWLSEQEGIPKEQWCYEPNTVGQYASGMRMAANYLQRTGYRLPTEAEWEYACRASAATRFYFGESEELLPRYAWYANSAQRRAWPVGSLKPNDLGLFDMHGNVWDFCQDAYRPYGRGGDGKATEDMEDIGEILSNNLRTGRGGAYFNPASIVRSACRSGSPPTVHSHGVGLRPARTLPFRSLDRYAAARAAALAGTGQGKNQMPLDDAAKAKLRRQALDWLKAELTNWSKVQPPRPVIVRRLWHWQQDSGLAGIRDKAALANLPAEEQKAFAQLWADVARAAEPSSSAERLEFVRAAVQAVAGQGKEEPALDAAAKEGLRGQALGWLKAELTVSADRAGKATIIAAAAPLPELLEKLSGSAPNDALFQAELARYFAERGNTALANAARTKAQALFEQQMAKEPENSALAGELADVLLIDRHTLVPTSEHAALTWRFTTSKPADEWTQSTFNDSRWPVGAGPFSAPGHFKQARTAWSTPDIWLRRNFTFDRARDGESLYLLRVLCDDNAEVYLNGKLLVRREGNTEGKYLLFESEQPVRDLFLPGTNTLAVHGFNRGIGYVDAGLYACPAGSLALAKTGFAAMELTDPWAKLAAAYAMNGRNKEASQYFGKALQQADGYEARKPIVEFAARFDDLLSTLIQRRPDDSQVQLALARKLAERGKQLLAEKQPAKALAELQKSREAFTRLPAEPQWTVLTPVEMKSNGGEKLTVEKDGSIFVSGPNPARAVYTLKLRTDLPALTAIRLETIPDARLPDGGAGRYGNGNFHVAEFTAAIVSNQADAKPTPLNFGSAHADWQQTESQTSSSMIDGNPNTWWDTHPRIREPHWAVFSLRSPARIDGGSLSITLDSGITSWGMHGLGRFRLSVTNEADAFIRTPLRKDLKEFEVVDLNVALAKAHAQQGQNDEAVAAFARALALTGDSAGKARVIAEAVALKGALEKLAERAADNARSQAALARYFTEQGNKPLANAARTKARALFEARLAKEPENSALAAELAELLLIDTTRWTVLTPTQLTSEGGATLKVQPGGAVLATGVRPDRDVYTLEAEVQGQVVAVKLEALTDQTLPGKGPGRSDTGNFHLNDIRVTVAPGGALVWSRAYADFEQQGLWVRHAIDTDLNSPWGIAPKTGEPHWAVFVASNSDAVFGKGRITIRLDSGDKKWVGTTLGHFRLSVCDDPAAIEREEKRLAVLKITDPWIRLAVAYAATGHKDEAVRYFSKVLAVADTYDARNTIVEHLLGFDRILESLARQHPAEPQLQLALARNLAARGKTALAAGKAADALAPLKQSQDIFTRQLALPRTWTLLTPVEMKTENGSRLELQKDGSIFVHQPAGKDTCSLVFQTPLKGIKGLQLEALTDSRLPGGGPGWSSGAGNFVLSELTLQAAPAGSPDQTKSIALRNASTDFSQQGWEIRGAVDGNPGTGWAVWPEVNKDHTAIFELAEEVGDGQESRLKIQLHHQHGDPSYLLGRFRLSVTTDAATLQNTRIRLDLKDGEVVELNLALAKAHVQQGQGDEAVAAFARALALSRDRAGKARVIAEASPLKGALGKLAESVPDDGQSQAELARQFAEQGDKALANAARAKARALFEKQLAAEPDNAVLASDLAELLLSAVATGDQFWIDDAAPSGARLQGNTPWEWVSKPDHPVFRGQKAMRRQAEGLSQHFFDGADSRLRIGHGARLFAYVFLDPKDPPKTVMLQFNDGNWSHRAFWGEDLIPYGMGDKEEHLPMGPLPKAGEWVRLEVEAARVGLRAGAELNGWAFTQHGGTCYWDAAGGTKCTTSFVSPWLTLTAAYAMTGENDRAGQYASKALEAADSDEVRKAICEYAVSVDRIRDSLVKRHAAEPQLQLALARNLAARGKTALTADKTADALAPLKQSQELFTRLLAPPQDWTVLTPVEMKTDNGSRLELQKDGSIFVHQPAKRDTYSLVFQTRMKGIKGLRLEALTDSRLPRGGPGWATDFGNFVLSQLSLQVASARSPDQPRSIPLRNASADFCEVGFSTRGAVDGNASSGGWAVNPEIGKDHTALFDLAREIGDGQPIRLTVRLNNSASQESHLLGRFRLSFTTDASTLQVARIRLDLKDSELVDLNVALAKAHAQQGQGNDTVAAIARALALATDGTVKFRIIATAAALASVEKGRAAPDLDDTAKARLRRQTLDWLKAELAVLSKQLESAPPESIVTALSQWRKDADLAGIRDAAALAKLPADEQKEWQALWAEVASSLRFRMPRVGPHSEMRQDHQGKWLAVPNGEAVALFDARTGELVHTLTGHFDRVHTVAFSPDGRYLAGGNLNRAGGDKPYVIKVWDLQTGKVTATLEGTLGWLFTVAFDTNGKRLFCGGEKGLDVWDLASGKIARSFAEEDGAHWFYSFAVSPDGKKLAWGNASTKVKVWEIGSDNPPVSLEGHKAGVNYAAFSPEGKLLATGSDTELLLWDAEKLELVKRINTSAGWLAFEPGGKSLLTATHSPKGTTRVVTRWDLATFKGQPLLPPNRGTGYTVYHLSSDGKTLFSLINDGAGMERRVGVNDLLALSKRYSAIMQGEGKLADNVERLQVAQAALDQQHFAFATRLWAEALTADPKLGDDRQAPQRHLAARAAVLAAAGQGKDEPPLDDPARAKLRAQALDWLTLEVAAWGKVLEAGPPEARPLIVPALSHWQKDTDLAGIRDKEALDKLPAGEQKAFTRLWADVAGLLTRAEEKPK
jgi:formylglycine-generating enzyme required for sulfatase activity/tetratricopeptide (TPR) repeat protein